MNKKIKTNNFEDEIENILKENGILSDDGLVYESANVRSIPRFGGEDELKSIIREHALLFEDENYFYVVMNDATLFELQGRTLPPAEREFAVDFSVEKLKKSQYKFLGDDYDE